MNDQAMLTLKAKLDAANKRITDHKPLEHSAAIEKVLAFAAKRGMTKDDLFPKVNEWEGYNVPEVEPFWDETPFSAFCHPDTFNYTFIADLEEQRDAIESEIFSLELERQNEAIERVRAFIKEYDLRMEDIYPLATKTNSQTQLPSRDGNRNVAGARKLK
jgi:hypothetical protein